MLCGDLSGTEIQKKKDIKRGYIKKEWIFLNIELIYFAIQQKLTQYYKAIK